MPRRLVQDSYRGNYGWESTYNASLRMSIRNMWQTNASNERERFRHRTLMNHLVREHSDCMVRSSREEMVVKRELTNMVAYGRAYREHSFYKQENTAENTKDKDVTTEKTSGPSVNNSRYPEIQTTGFRPKDATLSFGSLVESHGTDDDSFKSNKAKPSKDNKISTSLPSLYTKRPKQRPTIRLFPEGCKTAMGFKRFIDREAQRQLEEMSPESVRRRRVQRLQEQMTIPTFVSRSKTTSAILRDYTMYKEAKQLTLQTIL